MSDVVALLSIAERGIVIGEVYDSESAVVQQNPTWFSAPTDAAEPAPEPEPAPIVEAATAAPGEIRETPEPAPEAE